MKTATLCFVLRNGTRPEILLGRKKRGFGEGKLNGFGGKPEAGESLRDAAAREVFEEAGIQVSADSLQPAGQIVFLFPSRPAFDHHVHVFLTETFDGEPSESEEMAPAWFPLDRIPYDRMWQDDGYWLPRVLAGCTIDAEFRFGEDNETVIDWRIDEVEPGDGLDVGEREPVLSEEP